MNPANPTDDLPSTESEQCDCCSEPWAVEVDRRHGPRDLRLCEVHADRYLRAERAFDAELEEMAGRGPTPEAFSALFGLARALDGRVRRRAS